MEITILQLAVLILDVASGAIRLLLCVVHQTKFAVIPETHAQVVCVIDPLIS